MASSTEGSAKRYVVRKTIAISKFPMYDQKREMGTYRSASRTSSAMWAVASEPIGWN